MGCAPRAWLPHRVHLANLEGWRSFRRVQAFCPVCGHRGSLLYELPDVEPLQRRRVGVLAESLRCRGCSARMSGRALAVTLLELLVERGVRAATADSVELPPDVTVLVVDAHNGLAARVTPQPGVVRGVFSPADRTEESIDLERLPFPDEHFDVVLTSQVLEHTRRLTDPGTDALPVDLVDQCKLTVEHRKLDRPELGIFGADVFLATKPSVVPGAVPRQD